VAQIVKSIIFRAHDGRGVLVLTSGANRVDEAKLVALLGQPVGKADADFVRDVTGFAIGGVPPLAHAQPLLTLIDEDLLSYEFLWAAAGTPSTVFRLSPQDLLRLAPQGRVGAVKK
jgi:prolyl-tRNA editing enzyme YbaK/EbsC (Cys-tRNA(Pro) deacylase)